MIHLTDINEFEHVAAVAAGITEPEKVLFKASTGEDFDVENFLVALSEVPGQHYIFWNGEKPVAIGGFIPQRPGVLRTWFIAPETSWKECGRELSASCRELLAKQFDEKLAHRIETVTLADRAEARAWYERIGLTYESTQRGYGANGEDAVMYVAVRGVETTECAVA